VVSDQQKMVLWDLSEKNKLLYNFALAERQNNFQKEKKKPKDKREFITYQDQHNQLPE
jgi:putative transposase